MSRTKRWYNKKNNTIIYHPYAQLCMGNCPHCRSELRRPKTDKKELVRIFRKEGWGD